MSRRMECLPISALARREYRLHCPLRHRHGRAHVLGDSLETVVLHELYDGRVFV